MAKDRNILEVEMGQGWRDALRNFLNGLPNTEVLGGRYDESSTTWITEVATPLNCDALQQKIWADLAPSNWVAVRPFVY